MVKKLLDTADIVRDGDLKSIDTLVCGHAIFVLCLSEMRDMIFECAISFTMTDDEAFQRLKRLGCNFMEPCVDLDYGEKIKDNVRPTYMLTLRVIRSLRSSLLSSKGSCITFSDSESSSSG